MKKLLIFLFVLLTFKSNAQLYNYSKDTTIGVLIDTVINSRFEGGADTALSMSWVANNVNRELGSSAYFTVKLYGRRGNLLHSFSLEVPASVVDVWVDNSAIDDYIFAVTRYRKKVKK